jgi:(5-formylfuran-3-yl)methyl phosphate synthase
MDLLVSVRSAAEGVAALTGGAGLIDVKEPARGSLGCADAETVAAVLRAVAGRRPLSAALGELSEKRNVSFPLAFAKWGLAGCCGRPDWPEELEGAAELLPAGCRPVAVAYADWQRAGSPPPQEVCAFARARRWGAFLIDTWAKDGTTLLNWLSLDNLREMIGSCRAAGVPIALAGSLGVDQLRQLRTLQPDWFAVRGAACQDGSRTHAIDAGRVRQLVELLREPVTASIPAD